MEEYRGKSPFPAVRCPPPPLAAFAHARGGRGGEEDALRGLLGEAGGGGHRGADPRGLNLVSRPALSEHPRDRDCDLIA